MRAHPRSLIDLLVRFLALLLLLICVPESPRWLFMQGKEDEALAVMKKFSPESMAKAQMEDVRASVQGPGEARSSRLAELFDKPLRLVLAIGITVAILQQITGINSVFFYAPMIFEQSGIGTDASYMQAVLVGLTNLVFTLVAIALIDKIGRKTLLSIGVSGIASIGTATPLSCCSPRCCRASRTSTSWRARWSRAS